MPTILKPGENCSVVDGVDSAGLLVDGRDYYSAFYYAALKAKRHIIISGWQFDSETELLRGADARGAPAPSRFLDFLNALCERNTELRVYILSWDFSIFFALEREWMQEWVFNWSTNGRLWFRFDDRHAIGASQHQKFIVIDGLIAYLGGMDICAGRWDDRTHLAANTLRTDAGNGAYGPYHDIQTFFTGPLVKELTAVFKMRWLDVTGVEIELPALDPLEAAAYLPDRGRSLPVGATNAALSRTRAQTLKAAGGPVQEIRRLYADAIAGAESYIYIENQYFSSYAVGEALARRMKDRGRPGIDIIIILPKETQKFVEEISVGLAQARLLSSLRAAAKDSLSRLGVYYPAAFTDKGAEAPVFIHSKLMLVDDRFMTIGSANTTNRSMGLDDELNVSFEAASGGGSTLAGSLKRLRMDLLAEHCGLDGRDIFSLEAPDGLVDYLDRIAGSRIYRLQRYQGAEAPKNNGWIKRLDEMFLDPEKAVIEENIFEIFSPDINSLFAGGITLLRRWLRSRKKAG